MTVPVAPAAPVPAAGSPANQPKPPAQAGAPVVPKPPAQAGAPVEPGPDATKAEIAEYKKKLFETEKKVAQEKRDRITERRQWDNEKKGLGEKLSRLSELEKRERSAKLDPGGYLESIYGKDWYDVVVNTKVSGGAPTAGTVESEIQKVRDEFQAKFDADKAERAKAEEAASAQRVAEARRTLRHEGLTLVKAQEKDYPLLATLPDPGLAIAQHIEEAFNAAHAKAGAEDIVTAMSSKEAADAIEAKLYELVEKAAAAEKYQPKLRERLTPAKNGGTVSPSSPQQGQQPQQPVQQERRTLSQAMTGSTPGERPRFRTDEERRAASVAAFNKARRPPE